MSLLLDTTVLIDVLRSRIDSGRVARAAAVEDIYVCAVNVEEVVRGIRPGEEPRLDDLLAGLLVAPLGRSEGERAGTWRRVYGARGVTLSQPDCLVAAAALGVDARLATANVSHFPMPEVTVEPWPSP